MRSVGFTLLLLVIVLYAFGIGFTQLLRGDVISEESHGKSNDGCSLTVLQPRSNGLQPNSDGFQPTSDGLQPAFCLVLFC